MQSIEERVAAMEAMLEQNGKDIENIYSIIDRRMEKEETYFKELIDKVNKIELENSRKVSFIAGVTFAISAIWAGLFGLYEIFKGVIK